ncbi:hypothetical protein [Cellulosimicrobium cellulans]|nr:hypothetical protein [Cellulosimicrobium cellulans]
MSSSSSHRPSTGRGNVPRNHAYTAARETPTSAASSVGVHNDFTTTS